MFYYPFVKELHVHLPQSLYICNLMVYLTIQTDITQALVQKVERITKGRITKGRITKGRITKGRITKGRITKGRIKKVELQKIERALRLGWAERCGLLNVECFSPCFGPGQAKAISQTSAAARTDYYSFKI